MSAPFWRSSSAEALAMPDAPPTMTAFFPLISTRVLFPFFAIRSVASFVSPAVAVASV